MALLPNSCTTVSLLCVISAVLDTDTDKILQGNFPHVLRKVQENGNRFSYTWRNAKIIDTVYDIASDSSSHHILWLEALQSAHLELFITEPVANGFNIKNCSAGC
jgi:hypothetical protein